MKLKNPPVNSLSLEFLTEFVISLEKLENDKSFRGVILTSVGACSSHTRTQPWLWSEWSPLQRGTESPGSPNHLTFRAGSWTAVPKRLPGPD